MSNVTVNKSAGGCAWFYCWCDCKDTSTFLNKLPSGVELCGSGCSDCAWEMRITNLRKGRIARIAACVFILVPLLYLLLTWSDGHKRAKAVLQSRFGALTRPKEVPRLIEGEFSKHIPSSLPFPDGRCELERRDGATFQEIVHTLRALRFIVLLGAVNMLSGRVLWLYGKLEPIYNWTFATLHWFSSKIIHSIYLFYGFYDLKTDPTKRHQTKCKLDLSRKREISHKFNRF